MKIGVVKEIKPQEARVALTPAGARELVARGHDVVVEAGAGEGSGFPDDAYVVSGRRRSRPSTTSGRRSELLLKVKEPLPAEYAQLRPGLVLFTYLHLAPAPELTQALIDSGATCVAYETVETDDHRLPLLAPMSEVAGRLAPQMGAHALEKAHGGRGVLLGGVAGVAAGQGRRARRRHRRLQRRADRRRHAGGRLGARPLDRPHARARPDARRPRDGRDVDPAAGRGGASARPTS